MTPLLLIEQIKQNFPNDAQVNCLGPGLKSYQSQLEQSGEGPSLILCLELFSSQHPEAAFAQCKSLKGQCDYLVILDAIECDDFAESWWSRTKETLLKRKQQFLMAGGVEQMLGALDMHFSHFEQSDHSNHGIWLVPNRQ